MTRCTAAAIAILFVLSPSPAQTVNGVGLELVTPAGTFGVACGPFTCTPVPAAVPGGARYMLTGYAYPSGFPGSGTPSPILFGISTTPGRCLTIPGIAQQLVLSPTLVVFRLVFASGPGPLCPGAHAQGAAPAVLDVPATLPPGSTFLLQAAGTTCSSPGVCQPGFSRAIQLTIL